MNGPPIDAIVGVVTSTDLQDSDAISRCVRSQVLRILDRTGLYVDNITSRYFNGVHKWLPVISRPLFNRRLLAHQTAPSATFAVLLLSMTLVSQYPAAFTSTTGYKLEMLFNSTKLLFAQVQASVAPTLSLIQAGLLISTYERAHSLVEAAYISIGTCARMSFTAGIQQYRTSVHDFNEDIRSQSVEEKNLWWGIKICDR
jgi:hypothetical protein